MENLSCPKCGAARPSQALECAVCGIIFAKYQGAATPRNPYAAPRDKPVPVPVPEPAGGAWSLGDLLVVGRGAKLPDQCVRCNRPTRRRWPAAYPWSGRAVHLLRDAAPTFYKSLAADFPRAALDVPLCVEHDAKRKRNRWISSILLLAGAPLLPLTPFVSYGAAVTLTFLGIVLLGTGLWLAAQVSPFKAVRVSRTHLWLEGACPEFLCLLPVAPAEVDPRGVPAYPPPPLPPQPPPLPDVPPPVPPEDMEPLPPIPLFKGFLGSGGLPQTVSVWHHRRLLVFCIGGELPGRCVFCNQPTDFRWSTSFTWNPAGGGLSRLLGPLSLLFMSREKIEVPLCAVHRAKRRRDMVIAGVVSLAGLALLAALWFRGSEDDLAKGLGALGVGLGVAGLGFLLMGATHLSAVCIKDGHIWLRGAGDDFLASLPAAPAGLEPSGTW